MGGGTLGSEGRDQDSRLTAPTASDPFSIVPMMIHLKCKLNHISAWSASLPPPLHLSPNPNLISCTIKPKALK